MKRNIIRIAHRIVLRFYTALEIWRGTLPESVHVLLAGSDSQREILAHINALCRKRGLRTEMAPAGPKRHTLILRGPSYCNLEGLHLLCLDAAKKYYARHGNGFGARFGEMRQTTARLSLDQRVKLLSKLFRAAEIDPMDSKQLKAYGSVIKQDLLRSGYDPSQLGQALDVCIKRRRRLHAAAQRRARKAVA